MKRILITALSFVAAAGVQAQRIPAPVQQSAAVDIAAAFEQRYRAMIEPLVFGRFSLGLSGEYTTEPGGDQNYIYYPGYGCGPYDLCAVPATPDASYPCCGYPYPTGSSEKYRAWSFNLHGRWYPAALSIRGERQSASFFVGEFVGYHERRISQSVYYGCPACDGPPPMGDTVIVRPDTVITQPVDGPYYYPGPSTFTQKLKGWEPGVEFGVRVWPTRHVVIDVGGEFRLARLADYQSGKLPGDVHKRLMVTVGVGW